MPNKKGQVGSPSLTQPGSLVEARRRLKRAAKAAKAAPPPRCILEDGESVEITADPEVYRPKPARRVPKPPLPITVTLQMRHSFNGRFLGPGTVTLSEGKARALLNTEHEAMAKEATLYQQQAFIIGFRNGVPVRREVPAQRFDDILAHEELPIETMGGGR